MNKQIVSEMQWTDEELSTLAVEGGFRMRGLETTRLDTLIDAAFAFVLSVLVISQSGIPQTYAELIIGVKSIPALAMSFWVLMLFWLAHREWSRRFGIESRNSILISVSLVFALLVYVYPLRILFESMFHGLSNGFFPMSFEITTDAQLRGFFAFYSCGYLLMALLMSALQASALRRRFLLNLSDFELWNTKATIIYWLLSGLVAIIALLLSLFIPIHLIGLAGYIFFSIFVMLIIRIVLNTKARKRLSTSSIKSE